MATTQTIGRPKVDVLKKRLLEISPDAEIDARHEIFCEATASSFHLDDYDYIVDAIDSVADKALLINMATRTKAVLVSSMGAGAKLDATAVRVADIAQTRMCPLAHMLRKRLHKFGIYTGFQAVFSVEEPRRNSVVLEESRNKKSQVGTVSYLPSVFGAVCAQVAIRSIVGI